jgi:hypothetical protein
MSELQVIAFFDSTLEPLIRNFRSNLKKIVSDSDEPLLVIKYALEYEKFLESQEKQQEFKSRSPIYLDATSSGPQMVSLILT